MPSNVEKNNALISLVESPAAKFWKEEFSGLSPAEQVFLVVWELEAELNEGGFHQYYASAAGDRAVLAPAAFERLGATAMAAIVAEANRAFGPGGPPADRAQRRLQLAGFGDAAHGRLAELDADFHAYPDNLTDRLYAFVAAGKHDLRGASPEF